MRMNRIWGTLAAIACVLGYGARAEAQLAKQGTYAGHFGWYAVGKTVELEPGHEFFLGEYSGTFLNDAGQGSENDSCHISVSLFHTRAWREQVTA